MHLVRKKFFSLVSWWRVHFLFSSLMLYWMVSLRRRSRMSEIRPKSSILRTESSTPTVCCVRLSNPGHSQECQTWQSPCEAVPVPSSHLDGLELVQGQQQNSHRFWWGFVPGHSTQLRWDSEQRDSSMGQLTSSKETSETGGIKHPGGTSLPTLTLGTQIQMRAVNPLPKTSVSLSTLILITGMTHQPRVLPRGLTRPPYHCS